jgi:hypothetical protein
MIVVNVAFLKPVGVPGAERRDVPNVRAIRKLGMLKKDQFDIVFAGLLRWLGYMAQQPLLASQRPIDPRKRRSVV